ncbi:hypothetical protein JL721_6756 [Aureococcus anophagefferens]|nr:hypothetical protein JL721_6756 [Aureococcus anophagefferens]
MAWGFGMNEDVTQYKRAAKLDHGTGMTICRLARLNGINLLKYLVENIDEPCFASRDYSPLAAQSGRLPRACTLRDASARGGDGGDALDRFEEAGDDDDEACYVCGDPLGIAEPSIFCVGCGQKAHVICVGQRSQGDHLCDECAESARAPPGAAAAGVDPAQHAPRLRADDGGGATAADRRGDDGGDDDVGRADGRGDGDGGFDAAYPELLRIHNLPGFWHLLEAGGIKVIFKLYYKSLLGRCAHDVLKRKGITIKAAKFFQATELFYHVWEAMATALFRAHRKSQTFRESPVDLDTPGGAWTTSSSGTARSGARATCPSSTTLIHLGACDITNKYNLKRQCFYSLVKFLTSSEDVAKGLLAASTEIKQGEIQKSMGPKFGVAKVLIHSALNDLLSGVAKSFADHR